MTEIAPTDGVKMQYLIARRSGATREELIAHWFANHMPGVIASQHAAASRGAPHASRYIATLFDPVRSGEQVWDGVAQLWFDAPLPRASTPHGSSPRDTFQQKAAPYEGWPTREFVVVDGALPLQPNTLNEPFPCTRSGFLKVTSLLTAKPDTVIADFFAHWLEIHAPNVESVMQEVGAFRYVISQSLDPDVDRYAGMAELYFPDKDSLRDYNERYVSDGIEEFVVGEASPIFRSGTEMVGID